MPIELTDFELAFLVKRVGKRLQEGADRNELINDIAGVGCDREEARQLVAEIEDATRRLGRPPNGCTLLRQRSARRARLGIPALLAGVALAALGLLGGYPEAGFVAGGIALLCGLNNLTLGLLALRRYRD
jgi:hypothetical protein